MEEINEKKLMVLAEAKREWADLTDFEVTTNSFNKVEPNEFTKKGAIVTISK